MIKMSLPPSCFLTLFKDAETVQRPPVGVSEEGTQNRAAPMTHLFCRRISSYFFFLGGKRDLRSQHLFNQLGTASAGGKAHHQRLIKDLCPFRRVFSQF